MVYATGYCPADLTALLLAKLTRITFLAPMFWKLQIQPPTFNVYTKVPIKKK